MEDYDRKKGLSKMASLYLKRRRNTSECRQDEGGFFGMQ